MLQEIRQWLWRTADEALDKAASEKASARPLVYVVEDELGICKIFSLRLVKHGIEVHSFASAEQTVAALTRRQPDLMFLDLALKGSDAVQVIRALGAMHYGGIVQLMSGSDAVLLEDVRRVGARYGLTMPEPLKKPFRAESIDAIVEEAGLGGRQPAQVGIRQVIANRWLELWYQPKIDLRTMQCVGVEALARCRHPRHGILGPASFIDGAGDKDLTALAEFVVATALRDWDSLADTGIEPNTAVNVSLGALEHLDIPALLRDNLPASTARPALMLEVTESEAITDVALLHEIATQLRIYGIRFAIDDFGKGYSSFARLRELPFDELKLDATYVKDCAADQQNAGICRAVVDLAHHFGAVACAEGIETEADLAAIRQMGCDLGQGYLFARPMPKQELAAVLRLGAYGDGRHAPPVKPPAA